MISPQIPWRYRIATRQSVPILVGLIGLLSLLIALGYFYAREHILIISNAQVKQFVSSISRQDDYTQQWIMRSMHPLTQAIEHAVTPQHIDLHILNTQIPAAISDARGKQRIQLSYIEENSVQTKYYDSTGILPAQELRSIFEQNITLEQIRQTQKAFWSVPHIDAHNILHLRYTTPLKDAQQHTYALITSSVAIAWFTERIRSFSFFKQCIPFFLTSKGEWTLPSNADKELDFLKKIMLKNTQGMSSVTWKEKKYIAVFLPSGGADIFIGVLIPRTDLFGHIDTIVKILAVVGAIIVLLATYGLHRTCKTFLQPLTYFMVMADKLAHGKLNPAHNEEPMLATSFPLETEKLRSATQYLRVALHQRMRDLTVMAQTRERLDGELAFARTIQNSLRPKTLPQSPHVSLAAKVHEAREVCGDMYDCFQLNEEEICCVIGNVAEHGVPAALLTNRIMPLLHERLLAGLSPHKALEHVNYVFETDSDKKGLFISAFVGILHIRSGVFRWASAGQNPPFILSDTASRQLPWSGNVPLGIRTQEQYEEYTLQLEAEQTVIFMPQRLLSIADPQGHTYGEKRLTFFFSHVEHTPDILLQSILEDIVHYAQSPLRDDIVLFAMQWHDTQRT